MLVGSVLIGEANASRIIGNPAMGADQSTCKGGSCLPPPSNPPSRGCEKIFRCRKPPPHVSSTIVLTPN
ncbi:hypothetical protein DITRI_Ditri20bG0119100 [Diplodiscus trichospermus]